MPLPQRRRRAVAVAAVAAHHVAVVARLAGGHDAVAAARRPCSCCRSRRRSPTLPSSHVSPAVRMPLPQPVAVQLPSQPSPLTRLPSSQASPAVATPLPQPVAVQLLSQPSPLTRLPSSQASPAVRMRVAAAGRRAVAVAAVAVRPGCRRHTPRRAVGMPLPQPVSVQLASQPSPLVRLPSSHCSPAAGLSVLSPQAAAVQSGSQRRRSESAVVAGFTAGRDRCCRIPSACSWRRSRRR